MRILAAAEVDAALPIPGLVDRLQAMFRDGCDVPLRHHHTVPVPGGPDGTLLLMPAWQQGRHLGIKIVTVFPGNADRGLTSVLGSYLLLDGTTGQTLAMLDGTMLTLRRTAAASALAARFLARPDASVLAMVGTGALAPHLVRAHRAVRPIREVRIWGRSADKAEALAARLSAERAAQGPAIMAVADLATAVRGSDVVSCATLSRSPLVQGGWLKPGAHLDLVGGFTPEMREADDEAVRRASVFVDTRQGACKEAGDIVQPLRSGVLSEADVRGDLYELARGTVAGRRGADEITFFKSVGTALEDLAAAQLAVGA
ncbi:MAG TPA: ornithine cyclodeaminase family protein [Azospirillaceae bacterium]|nr:ornithine cyclodeaminase family protein [Azospirillaceae bacterium]